MAKPRLIFSALVLALCCLPAHASTTEIIDLPWSQWQVHIGDDPACASDSCAWQAAPEKMRLRQTPGVISKPYIWVRKEIQLPLELSTAPSLAFLVQMVEPVYDVYAGDRLVGGSGSFTTHNGPLNTRQIFPIPPEAYAGGRLVLILHLQNAYGVGFLHIQQPVVGLPAAVEQRRDLDTLGYLRAEWQRYLCYVVIFSISLFFLVLYFMDRSAREYLWFGLHLLLLVVLRSIELSTVLDFGFAGGAHLVMAGINMVEAFVMVEFPFAFIKRPVPWYFRIVQAGALSVAPFALHPFPVSHNVLAAAMRMENGVLLYVDHYSLLFASLASLVILPRCFRNKHPEMRWIGGAVVFAVFEEVNRHLTMNHLPGLPQTMQIGSLDFDLRGFAYFLYAIVMLVAMTFRFRRIQQRNRTVEQELAAAAAVQSLLISSRSQSLGSFAIESVYQPASEVGGDFFHLAPAPDGSLSIVVGDVSGKGLKAAMTVATILGALRSGLGANPPAVLANLNRVLCGQTSGFVTCCAAHIHPDGTMLLANAGHIPPYCNGEEFDCAPGLPLGILEQQEWTETEFRIDPNARLIFVSDGVVEAAKNNGELFGFDRTREISIRSAEAIAAAAQAFAEGAAQNDDITVLGVQFQPTPVSV